MKVSIGQAAKELGVNRVTLRRWEAAGKIQVDSPRRVVELVIPVVNAVFPEEGAYMLLFFMDGVQLGARVLEVAKAEQDPREKPPN